MVGCPESQRMARLNPENPDCNSVVQLRATARSKIVSIEALDILKEEASGPNSSIAATFLHPITLCCPGIPFMKTSD